MDEMTKYQRLLKTLRCEKTDRLPWSTYLHSSEHDRGVREFANFTLNFYKRFDPDYVKVMSDENYDNPVNFQYCWDINFWKNFEPLDPHKGAFGRQLESIKIIKDAVGPDVPVIVTVYSSFHWATRLSRDIVKQYRENEEIVDKGVAAITASLVAFVKACINEAGVDGFYHGVFGCEPFWMTEDEFKRWSMPHDKRVFTAMREAPMVIAHIHGPQKSYFDTCESFECDALSWEDRTAGISIAEARKKTKKCLVGGVDHEKALTATPEEVYREAVDAIKQSGGYGLILAPGCTFDTKTPAENMFALKRAVYDCAGKF
ncbi:MAG: uroporphyrinogen decarboxylase family protein [Spirochaetales bacterium]|jgi:uroporphyrinogen decarboxylase|nr:uroporphyrinogen decarboxylase family protein [Spirochaetales bacterium]